MPTPIITPTEIRGFADRIQSQMSSYPAGAVSAAAAAVSANNAFASALDQPGPVDPPSGLSYGTLFPQFNIRNYTWLQWTGVPNFQTKLGAWRPPYNTDSVGANAYYPKTKYANDRVTVERADVCCIQFIAPPAGYEGGIERTNMGGGVRALVGISDKRGQFVNDPYWSIGGGGAWLLWSTVPGDTRANRIKLVPGRTYWLMAAGIKRAEYFAGQLAGTVLPSASGSLTTSQLFAFQHANPGLAS
jgi:hypothetical protein